MNEKTQIQSSDPVADCDQPLTLVEGGITTCDTPDILLIEQRIYTVRGIQVMLDRDLAELYGIETGLLSRRCAEISTVSLMILCLYCH